MANIYELLATDNRQLTTTKNFVRKNNLFMQNEPNFHKSQMNVSRVSTKNYEKRTLGRMGKTKPNKANSKPIKANLPDAQNERNIYYNKGL